MASRLGDSVDEALKAFLERCSENRRPDNPEKVEAFEESAELD
jgi:hypothetical protein